MNINNFERYLDKTILERGYGYYLEGRIMDAFEHGINTYVFHIEGSDDYEVVVELDERGEIVYSDCDCLYDFGPVCKHEVAAYFQLFEMLNSRGSNDKAKNKSKNDPTLEEVLSTLSKEKLTSIILDIAHQDGTLEKSIIVKYSNGDTDQELEMCRELIDAIVRKYTGREGYIKYRDVRDFAFELEDILEKARNADDPLLAVDIAFLLLEEAMNAFQYADDSGGDIGSLVTDTIEVVGEIASNCIGFDGPKKELFAKILAEVDDEVFDGWEDFRIDLLNICLEFADDEMLRKLLNEKIESMIDQNTSDRYMSYWNESLFDLLLRLIEQYGTEEEVEQFIYANLQYSSFREKLLNQLIKEKNYQKVIEVAKEGEKKDGEFPGLVSNWKKFRYIAYKSLSLKSEQKSLATAFLLAGDFEYYFDLKELAAENYEAFYAKLKQVLKAANGYHTSRIFLKLIEEENDMDELLEFVRNNPSYIEEYSQKLMDYNKGEVVRIYEEYIKLTASTSSNRRAYQGVCYKIKRFKKIAGKEKYLKIIDELMVRYKNRPAFIDELGTIK